VRIELWFNLMMKRYFFIIVVCFMALAVYGAAVFYFIQPSAVARYNFLAQINEPEQQTATTSGAALPDNYNPEVSVIFVGDIMLSRGVAQKIKQHNDLHYPFLKIRDYLESADLVFGNLETALIQGREIGPAEMVFRAAPEMAFVLKDFGFSVISLANNHTMNFGQAGLADTMLNLAEAQVAYAGAGHNSSEAYWPAFVVKNGLLFAFLSYTDNDVVPASYFATATSSGVAYMDIAKMKQAVNLAKLVADVVIVSMHSGAEYSDRPNTRQIKFAHAAIDAGADLVIGHHPHVVQTAEKYKGKYIFYSLGNFVFDQRATSTRQAVVIKAVFNKSKLLKIEPQAIFIENFSQPVIIKDGAGKNILSRLKLSF